MITTPMKMCLEARIRPVMPSSATTTLNLVLPYTLHITHRTRPRSRPGTILTGPENKALNQDHGTHEDRPRPGKIAKKGDPDRSKKTNR